jgi:hypothetical protein
MSLGCALGKRTAQHAGDGHLAGKEIPDRATVIAVSRRLVSA